MTGSTKIKTKTTSHKPKVPQSVIDKWLNGHPEVNPSGFTFSMLKDLGITGSTITPKSSASTMSTMSQTKNEMYEFIKNFKESKTGNTFSFSSLTKSLSGETKINKFALSGGTKPTFRTSGSTGPHRVKAAIPTKESFVPKSAPSPKKLLKTGLSLSEPALVFTAGTVDYSFPNGENYGFTSTIYDIKVQPDGKILVAGDTGQSYYYDGDSWDMQGLIRLNSDGTIDETFNITYNWDCWWGGGFSSTVYSIALQDDGKIICGGGFTSFDRNGGCNDAYRLIRLNSDGSRDWSFNIGDGFNDDVYSVLLQPDGKILVAGYFDYFNGRDAYRIIRLNPNGSVDNSFNYGTSGFDNYVNKILLQPDGKILCGGVFSSYSGQSSNYIARLNSNGTLDTTFYIGNGFNDEVTALGLQSDGKIIVGGYFNYFDNNYLNNGYIVRLDSDGNLDTIFEGGLSDSVQVITIQPDNKILVGGYFTSFYANDWTVSCDELIRFNADCSFDYSFYYEELFNDSPLAITLQSDGKILVGGYFNNDGDSTIYPLNYFGRLNNSIQQYPYVYLGYIDWCFDGYGTYVTVGSMTPPIFSYYGPENIYTLDSLKNPSQIQIGLALPGNINFGGYPTNAIEYVQVSDNGTSCNVASENNFNNAVCFDVFDGVPGPFTIPVDKKFKVGDYGFLDYSWSGENPFKIYSTYQIVGLYSGDPNNLSFPTFEGITPYIPYKTPEDSVRANGQYVAINDCYYEDGTFALCKEYDICMDGGPISFYNTSNCGYAVFTTSYFYDYGYFSITGGTPTINSTKIWESCEECLTNSGSEGLINYDFQHSYLNGDVSTIVEQPDGKILVGGYFNDYDGDNYSYIIRFNSNGTVDNTFNIGSGFNDAVYAIALQSDGKILVGGDFDYYNGEYAGRIIRLNSDGSVDNGFTYNEEFNSTVYAIAIQNDGKIVVGGSFSNYYDYPCSGYVRLNSDGTPDTTFNQYPFEGNVYSILLEDIESSGGFYSNYRSNAFKKQNITLGGNFGMYIPNISFSLQALVKLSPDGTFINTYDNGFTGYYDGVYDMKKQSDGKLICVGGFYEYRGEYTPYNILRINTDGSQDFSFVGLIGDYDGGGFNDGYVNSIEILPNDKIMVGSNSSYFYDRTGYYENLGFLVRLNSDGTLDKTFTYVLDDDNVYKVALRRDKTLLVGGDFTYPEQRFLNMFIGEYFQLRKFTTCDGETKNIYLSSSFNNAIGTGNSLAPITSIEYSEISTSGLDLIYDGSDDDDYFVVDFPAGFSINFLSTTYTSVNVSSNPFITFGDPDVGDGAADCCFDIPNEIPTSTEQPGVYISFECPNSPGDFDGQLYQLWTGLTDGGNTLVVKYNGSDHCDDIATLTYGFRFYKNNPDYFDIIIEYNDNFFNGNPLGGVSDGISPSWISTFNSGSQMAYRIGGEVKPIKADINKSNVVCGKVGDVLSTPAGASSNLGGSMYFNGNSSVNVDNNINMDLDISTDFTIEWFQKFEGGVGSCCQRVFDIGSFSPEHVGVSLESGQVVIWIEGDSTFITPNTSYDNVWTHFAIVATNSGDRTITLYQDGVYVSDFINNSDINNFDGPTQLPLTIGNEGNGEAGYQGYITNFRWNKGTAYYTGNFSVPKSPLPVDGSQLLMLATDSMSLITDSSSTQTISSSDVSWSSESPFNSPPEYFITSKPDVKYDTCNSCDATVLYNTMLYVYGKTPYISNSQMTLSDIQKVQTFGPIFTTGGAEAYELLTYYK